MWSVWLTLTRAQSVTLPVEGAFSTVRLTESRRSGGTPGKDDESGPGAVYRPTNPGSFVLQWRFPGVSCGKRVCSDVSR